MSSQIKIEPPYKLKIYIFLKDYMTIFGLVILLFGQIFSLNENSHIDISSITMSFSETEKSDGKIIDVYPIYYAFFDKYINAYDYQMYHPDYGISYGTSFGMSELKKGDPVVVDYVKSSPTIHRIQGMSNSFINDTTYMYLVILLVGIYFLFVGAKRTRAFLKDVKNGYITKAKLYEKPTTRTIDETTYIVMKFLFTTNTGKTIKIKKELSNATKLLDDEEEFILYDENDPSKNYFVDRLPQKLKDYIYSEINRASKTISDLH